MGRFKLQTSPWEWCGSPWQAKKPAQTTVALLCTEFPGHLNPMLALAEQLVSRGWDVYFFVPRSARQGVEGVGARWRHLGSEDWDLYESAARGFEQWLNQEPPKEVKHKAMPYAVVPAILDVMPYLLRCMGELQPDFVVYDAAAPFGWVLAQVLGLPAVCCMSALPLSYEERENHSQKYSDDSIRGLDDICRVIWSEYGVNFNHNYAYECYSSYNIFWTNRFWHLGHQEFPSNQFHYWGPLVSHRSGVAQGLGNQEVDWLLYSGGLGTRQLVFFSLGTTATSSSTGYWCDTVEYLNRRICEAAVELPHVAFVVAVGQSPDLFVDDIKVKVEASGGDDRCNCHRIERVTWLSGEPVPSNVIVARSVDQQAVLSRAHAFVTHCGQNSCSEAIIAGVPIVAVPLFGDQKLNARRFKELGCGVMLCESGEGWDVEHITAWSLADAITEVMDSPYHAESMGAVAKRCWQDENGCHWTLSEKLAHMEDYVQNAAWKIKGPSFNFAD